MKNLLVLLSSPLNKLFSCRRMAVALFAILCLTVLGIKREHDVSSAVAAVAIGLAASNAADGIRKKGKGVEDVK